MLLNLLASSRSVDAARDALRKMGLAVCEQDLDTIATNLIEELQLRNSRPVDPDLLAVFFDGKYVEIKDGDHLRPACIYLVVGLGRDGKKTRPVLHHQAGPRKPRRLETVLRGLIE